MDDFELLKKLHIQTVIELERTKYRADCEREKYLEFRDKIAKIVYTLLDSDSKSRLSKSDAQLITDIALSVGISI